MRKVSALLALAALAASEPAQHYQIDSAHSAVTAKVSFLGLGSKTARFPAMRGSIRITPDRLDEIDLWVELDARALMAGSKYDTDLLRGQSFFDVAHHPQVTFSGRRMVMQSPVTARIEGTITARGISRPVSLDVSFRDPPSRAAPTAALQLRARTKIDRRQFGMTSYSGIVGRTVTITIDARLVPG